MAKTHHAGLDGDDLLVATPLRLEQNAIRRGAPQLHVIRTGMGRARSLSATRSLRESPATRIAVAGVCGALDSRLQPGDLVVASAVRDLERPWQVTNTEGLVEGLERLGLPVHLGRILTLDRLVMGRDRESYCESGALAVDMESAWLAEGAGSRPLAVLRVVVDGPGNELVSLRFVRNVWVAMRALERAAPVLAEWAAESSRAA